MLRYLLTTLFVLTTCFAILHHTFTPFPLEPALTAGMTALILAQMAVAHLRSNWENQRELVSS